MNTLLRLAAPLALGACLVCAVAPALSRAEAPAKH